MYRSFTIKNFRCFDNLVLEPLGQVNLFTGMNNVGKTALLEAIFLHLGPNNPELPFLLNAFRGIERGLMDAEELWGWLFSGKRINDTIEISSLNGNGGKRSLRIRLVEPQMSRLTPPDTSDKLPPKRVQSVATLTGQRELTLEYEDTNTPLSISRVTITAEGFHGERAQLPPFPLGVFLTSRARFPSDDAQRFSKLEEQTGRIDDVVKALRILERRLQRLAVSVSTGVAMIHGDIGIGRLVPIQLMGEGMTRLLSILLAIASAPSGTVLVDEIENGLHHSIMLDVWKAIGDLAEKSETQVFATTHSWECVQAAHQAFEASQKYDFYLHRLDRVNDNIQVATFDQETLSTSVKMNLEVR